MAPQTQTVTDEQGGRTLQRGLEGELLIADGEGQNHNGWEWSPVPKCPGIFGMWVDDVADPEMAVAITPTSKRVNTETREGMYATRVVGGQEVNGYELIHGPTDGDGQTSDTIATVWGDPGKSPRATEQQYYPSAVEKAVEWMQDNGPETEVGGE